MRHHSRRAVLLAGAALALHLSASLPAEGMFVHRGGATSAPLPGGTITTFNVINTSASASKCRYRRGLWFAKGDIPSGSIPAITQGGNAITAQFDERNTWSDGSLKLCVLSMMDTDFSGNESRTYAIAAQVGTFNNTGLRTLSDITGAHTFQVKFANVTTYDGTNTVARGSGAFTADCNTHAGVATRVKNYHSGPVCSSWEIWGMATDNTGGAADPDLQTVTYWTAWNNPNGTLYDIEHGVKQAQVWWNPPNAKYRLNYDATYVDGGTTINTYSSVQHPYHAEWMTVRTNNDDNHGKRFWAGTIPTLYHTFDKVYARSTGLFPYLNPTYVPNSIATVGIGSPSYLTSYAPGIAFGHRAAINGTGDYQGRGLMPNTDCLAWMLQTSNNYRYARCNAFAGLHVPYHYRSIATRTIASGPQAGTDIANTVISLIMRPLSAPAYTFTAQGMPAPIDAYVGGASAPVTATFVAKSGYSGVWSNVGGNDNNPSSDASHAVAYSYGMYLLEGERHFMQATLDLGTNAAHQLNGNTFGGAPQYKYVSTPPMAALFSIPTTQWSGLANGNPESDNERNSGWGMMVAAQADIVCPDADVQAGFISLFRSQTAAFHVANMSYMPASQLAIGMYGGALGTNSGRGVFSNWMMNFNTQAHAMNVLGNEDANSLSCINNCFQNVPLVAFSTGLNNYASNDERWISALKTQTAWDSVTNPFLTPATMMSQQPVLVVSNVCSCTPGLQNNLSPFLSNGDVMYWIKSDNLGNAVSLPAGFSEATPYYATNCSGNTFQIEASPGSGALTIANGTYNGAFHPSNWNTAVAANPPYLPTPDSYTPIAVSALIMAYKAGANAITGAIVTNALAFAAGINNSQWATWNMAP